jgi:hypothetical protein
VTFLLLRDFSCAISAELSRWAYPGRKTFLCLDVHFVHNLEYNYCVVDTVPFWLDNLKVGLL